MTIRVIVEDLSDGTVESTDVGDDDYFLLTTGDCYLAHTNAYANGTHVLTVKGRKKGL